MENSKSKTRSIFTKKNSHCIKCGLWILAILLMLQIIIGLLLGASPNVNWLWLEVALIVIYNIVAPGDWNPFPYKIILRRRTEEDHGLFEVSR